MANFVAKYCAPSPVVDVVVTSPTGGALRSTTYRGLLDVSVDTNSGPTLTEGPVQFILPDSLPYPQAQVSSGASLSCSAAPVGFTPIGADVRTVIAGVGAAFVDDPRNAGAAAVQVSVQLQTTNLLESYTIRLAYEVTATVPHVS